MHIALSAGGFDVLPIADVVALAASSGYVGVELWARPPHIAADSAAGQGRSIKKMLDEHGLRCPCLSTSTGGYGQRDDVEAARQLERLLRLADIAGDVGAPILRQSPGGPSSREATDDDFERAATWLQRGADLLQASGLQLVVETLPGSLCDSLAGSRRLIRAVDRPNFGLLLDVGNLVIASNMPPEAEICGMTTMIKHVHIKDLELLKGDDTVSDGDRYDIALIGEGIVDHHATIAALYDGGYAGFVTIDQGAIEDAPLETRHNFVSLAALFRQVEGH